MDRTRDFACLAFALLLAGCDPHKGVQGPQPGAAAPAPAAPAADAGNVTSADDEAAVLASPQFMSPMMLHMSGDTFATAQVAASMNGQSIIYPPETHIVGVNLLPCRDTEDHFYPAGSMAFSAWVTNYPFPEGTLTSWLVRKGLLELQRYPIKHIQPDDPLYGKTQTWVCPVVSEKVREYLAPEQRRVDIHGGFDVPLMRRVFVEWTYRNRYETELFGMGKVKIFAGTMSYKLEAVIPGATPTKPGTASVKALLNPDTGRWQVDMFQATDPPVSLL
ncbi:MAG TPA: hypothetical protein VG889_18695 [Rhizomicrobium sp.]|nr:hypothetical protein [Rhizomicrobium sp.]